MNGDSPSSFGLPRASRWNQGLDEFLIVDGYAEPMRNHLEGELLAFLKGRKAAFREFAQPLFAELLESYFFLIFSIGDDVDDR